MKRHKFNDVELVKLLVMANNSITGRHIHDLTGIRVSSAQSNVSAARRALREQREEQASA
ncbi:hypothetical protein HOY34_13045 [Xinfangfangia sp. D13-10-4-6]|uniref:hypothetical protein n=1 Tax=Pseudogemmobacter hezensis TaxID=2737662 RepID=UPI001556142C|nr:hypothetical protein [Pseudogemmobacter hezensis]NPD16125.1 hypothetical protein [Pseudogemmobacter hezensis]